MVKDIMKDWLINYKMKFVSQSIIATSIGANDSERKDFEYDKNKFEKQIKKIIRKIL